jgi:hypothetical protein
MKSLAKGIRKTASSGGKDTAKLFFLSKAGEVAPLVALLRRCTMDLNPYVVGVGGVR